MNKKQNLLGQRRKIALSLPLERMIRGTLMERYLECVRPSCKCHKSKKWRHGPYFFISIRRGNRSQHVYVPQNMLTEAKKWSKNYDQVWEGIEDITNLNIKLLRLAGEKARGPNDKR